MWLKWENSGDRFPDEHFNNFWRILGYMLTVACQRPYRCRPKSTPLKIAFISWSSPIHIMGMSGETTFLSPCNDQLSVYVWKNSD